LHRETPLFFDSSKKVGKERGGAMVPLEMADVEYCRKQLLEVYTLE